VRWGVLQGGVTSLEGCKSPKVYETRSIDLNIGFLHSIQKTDNNTGDNIP
jgi:hypothetical protein